MKELYYYFIFAIILYFVLTTIFDNFNLEQENFDPSLVPVSSIITLAKVAQKLVNGGGILTKPSNLQIGSSSSAPGNLTINGTTTLNNTLNVSGTTTLSTLTASSATINNNLNVGNNIITNNAKIGNININTNKISTDNSMVLELNNNVRIANSNLNVDNDLIVGKSLTTKDINATDVINTTKKIQELGNSLLPRGSILAFNSSVAPGGWALCDGTNGTPDLRGRFIRMISGAATSPSATSPVALNVSSNPELKGTGRDVSNQNTIILRHNFGDKGGSDERILSVSELPSHTHEVYDPGHSHKYNDSKGDYGWGNVGNAVATSRTSNTTLDKSYILVNSTGSGNTYNIQPPYYTLVFIMKL